MLRHLLFTALILSGAAAAGCPDTGKVVITDVEGAEGFFLIGHYGKDSYSAYLHGQRYQPVDAAPESAKVMFRIDDVVYQQSVVARSAYAGAKSARTEAENLEAYFEWELAHIQEVARKTKADFRGHTSYGVVESKTHQGVVRKFFIWEIMMGDAKQYFVVTTSSAGVVLLSALGVLPSQEDSVKTVIDNYMYRFERLDGDDCPGA